MAANPPLEDMEQVALGQILSGNHRHRVLSHFTSVSIVAVTILLTDITAVLIAKFVSLNLDSRLDLTLSRTLHSICTLDLSWHGWGTLLVLGGLLLHLNGRGHYTLRPPLWAEFGDILRACGLAALCDFFIASVIYGEHYPPKAGALWVLLVPILLAFRYCARAVLNAAGIWSRRTLIIGAADLAEKVQIALESEPSLGYQVIGVVTLDSLSGHGASLIDLSKRSAIDFAVLALEGTKAAAERNLIATLVQLGLPFALAPCQGGAPIAGLRSQYFLTHDVLLLVTRSPLLLPFNRAIKYTTDVVTASILLVMLSPLMLAIAFLVAQDGGPILFRHERIGQAGRRFGCVKFRTMVINADKVLQDHLRDNPTAREEWAATQKLRDDPRVTAVGRVLRQNSLDELPQLLNVLRREMSLVGPRPIVSAEIARYGNDISYYYETKPGMTGLWQVTGRSDASYERRVHLDSWYVRNWTQAHDLAILLKTVPAVFLRRGAV